MGPATPDNQARGIPADDAESEMPARRYAIAEAAEALDVTTQTLQRWMRTTDTDITSERDPVERRLRWLNQQQVATLAKRHHRGELRPISRIEQHLIARLRRCEQRIEELEALVEELRAVLLQRGQSQPQPLEPFVPRPRPVRTRPLGAVSGLDVVPEGWMPWRRWAADHDVPLRTFEHLVKNGRIPVQRGQWRTAGERPVRVTEALDEAGQEAARRYFGKPSPGTPDGSQ